MILVSNTLSLHLGARPAELRTGVALSLVGLVVWAIAAVLLPAPLAARVFLLAPLVIAPRLLALFPDRGLVTRIAGWPALIAALPLVVAFGLPVGALAGNLAGALSLPWLAIALTVAIIAILDGLGRLAGTGRLAAIPELGVDAALGFWAVDFA